MGDVSKCFDSIYTHSVTWAVKDMPFAKRSIGAKSFGDQFDRLMQSMNYNETSGICIGPEVSRIFAETIFQRIDRDVEKEASASGLMHRRDYECVRYVDDIIIFAKDDRIAATLYAMFEKELGRFNLHFNDLKLDKFQRPFQTDKSWAIHKISRELARLEEQLFTITSDVSGSKLSPKHIFRPSALRLRFIDQVKSICREIGVSYDFVSNYIISSLSNRLENILDDHSAVPDEVLPSKEDYFTSTMLLLDILFHFYTMHPTVKSSFRVAKAIVISAEFWRQAEPGRSVFLVEEMMRWTGDLVRSFENGVQRLVTDRVPVEVINIALALSPHDDGNNLSADFVLKNIFRDERLEYFSVVSLLFFCGRKAEYAAIVDGLERKLKGRLAEGFRALSNSHDAHLVLDLICCPYLTIELRMMMVEALWTELGYPKMGKPRQRAIVQEMEADHWFVNWSGIDLLNMIKRKELSHVY